MSDYSYAQLEGLWIKAGGPRRLAPTAAAIAEAESGGNADAYNPTDNNGTQSSYGLWQISNGTHVPPSPNWADPATNASLAVGKWKGAGDSFTPWGTYNSPPGGGKPAYLAYLSGKTTPDMNVPGSATAATTAAAVQAGQAGPGGSCLVSAPRLGIGPVGIGGGCLFSKSNARAFIGTGLMVAGAVIAWVGIVILIGQAGNKVIAKPVQVLIGGTGAGKIRSAIAARQAASA